MISKIENEFFTTAVKHMGAELNSLKSKKSGIEYIWPGITEVWYGQAPILFPIIGRLLDDKYHLNNQEYSMPKHGFARKRNFELVEQTDTSMVFMQKQDNETLKMYPYNFELYVKYSLEGKTLTVEHSVVNKNDCDMYFSIGAHPGFNCELGDYLEFSDHETLKTERIDAQAIIIDEKFPLLDHGKTIEITADIFNHDALILSDIKSTSVTLKSKNHNRSVFFEFGKIPFLGIWAKPGAKYVCIEPWFGVNDSYDKKSDISMKRGIQKLPTNETFSFSWSATMNE